LPDFVREKMKKFIAGNKTQHLSLCHEEPGKFNALCGICCHYEYCLKIVTLLGSILSCPQPVLRNTVKILPMYNLQIIEKYSKNHTIAHINQDA
jgi:hypothetical protein